MLKKLTAISLFLIAVLIIFLGYLYFVDGRNAIQFGPYKMRTVEPEFDANGQFVDKKVFKKGEILTLGVDLCKTRNFEAVSKCSFVDGYVIDLDEQVSNFPAGCHRNISNRIKIPMIITPGKYHLSCHVYYQINPIKNVQVDIESEEFTITN